MQFVPSLSRSGNMGIDISGTDGRRFSFEDLHE